MNEILLKKPTMEYAVKNQLPECMDIIHKSFATVANEFGLTKENCPMHTSFMKLVNSKLFVHKGTQKFDHLPFTAGFMEWNC